MRRGILTVVALLIGTTLGCAREPPIESPERLTGFFESRWPISTIRDFCTPERRLPNEAPIQNLVVDGERWEGQLFAGKSTGFDKVFWYGSAKKGRLEEYSVNVRRGHDHWILEYGSASDLAKPPDLNAQLLPIIKQYNSQIRKN